MLHRGTGNALTYREALTPRNGMAVQHISLEPEQTTQRQER